MKQLTDAKQLDNDLQITAETFENNVETKKER